MLKFSSTAVAVARFFFISYDFTFSTHLTSDCFLFPSIIKVMKRFFHNMDISTSISKVDIDELRVFQEVLYIFFDVNGVASQFR